MKNPYTVEDVALIRKIIAHYETILARGNGREETRRQLEAHHRFLAEILADEPDSERTP